MSTLNFILAILLVSVQCQDPYDYNYDQNGEDWTIGNCQNGNKQSPIELTTQVDQGVPDSYLIAQFSKTPGSVYYYIDANTTIYLNTSSNFGSIYTTIINGDSVPFQATQIRMRVHAQHKVNGVYNDLQLQVFHTQLFQTPRNYRFAIAIFFNKSSEADPFLQTVIDAYQKLDLNSQIPSADIQVDLGHLFQKNMIQNFWYYNGSPTIPNCRDGQIHWVVYQHVWPMSENQYDSIVNILRGKHQKEQWRGNWRKIQDKKTNKVGYRVFNPQL